MNAFRLLVCYVGVHYFRDYEDESVAVFEPFLKLLSQLSYDNMRAAAEASRNITQSESYRRSINKKSLRSLMFEVT